MDKRKEVRFYICLGLGYILMILGFYTDPPGHITNSVLFAAGLVMAIGALGIGIDVIGIIEALNRLKSVELEKAKQDKGVD